MFRVMRRIRRKNRDHREDAGQTPETTPKTLSGALDKDIGAFRAALGESSDIIIKEFEFGFEKQVRGALLYVDGLTDRQLIDDGLLRPLMFDTTFVSGAGEGMSDIEAINRDIIAASDVKPKADFDEMMDDLLSGNTVLLVDGCPRGLSIGDRKFMMRSIEPPITESVVRGPREGFTESIRINTSMLRRKIKNPNLRLEGMKIGKQTHTDVAIAYIKGIVKPGLVEELKKRLERIDTDAIFESGYIEAYIEDAPRSIFSTVGNSERPDTIAAKLMEGRAAVFVDGTPFVLTVPLLFVENFITAEDYYLRPYFASYVRFLRFICYFISVMTPAIYVALTTFHQELIPTQLLFTMAAGLNGVPFPALLEAGLMVVAFDILREAGIRLPIAIGSAVSIVGALVIGQASVSAGLVGPFMVIIIATTAITNFVVSGLNESITILRYVFLIMGGLLGGFGIMMTLLAVLLHMITLRSFGTPFLSPFAPLTPKDLKDSFIRMPLWRMRTRPLSLRSWNIRRRKRTEPRPSGPAAGGMEGQGL